MTGFEGEAIWESKSGESRFSVTWDALRDLPCVLVVRRRVAKATKEWVRLDGRGGLLESGKREEMRSSS